MRACVCVRACVRVCVCARACVMHPALYEKRKIIMDAVYYNMKGYTIILQRAPDGGREAHALRYVLFYSYNV